MPNIDYELELNKAIALLYETFTSYPLNHEIAGCPCCVTEKDNITIKSKVLNKLTGNDLNHFAFKTISTWGTVEDFKHFLPRLLELVAFDRNFFWSGTVISKLAYAGFYSWEKREQSAINKYLIALWKYVLFQYPSPTIELREFIDRLTDLKDLNPFLLIWQNHSSINSLLHLADFIQNEIEFNKSPVKIISQRDRNTEQFLHWLMQPEIIEKLERAFFENINEPYANNFAIAIDILNCAIST